MYYLNDARGKHRRMNVALALALTLHLGLIFGVSFRAAETEMYSPQIEVTLATRPVQQAPDEARHVARANQLGSGDLAEFDEVTARNNTPLPTARTPRPAPQMQRDPRTEEGAESQLTSKSEAARRVAREQQAAQPQRDDVQGVNPEVDQLARELADLEAQLDAQSRAYSNLPRVRRLTSLSARESADAAYLQEWRQRVEAVGNKYYPEASVRYGIYGSLRLLVVIHADGALEDIRVLSSSGYDVLDEAAIKIVRMAAPYAPFPPELRAEADRVEIIRTWQFQENRLSSE